MSKRHPTSHRSYPRWIAPLMGSALGAMAGVKGMQRDGHPFDWIWPAGGAGIGLIAGLVVLLLDRPRRSFTPVPSTPIGQIVAALSIPAGLVPILGLPFNVLAYLMNRNAIGWPAPIAKIGLIAGGFITTAFVVAIAIAFWTTR